MDKPFNIVVCVKQVPDTQDIKWSENNNIIRDGMLSILNPLDELAINTAVEIKNKLNNVKITAISMGPKQAINVLKEGIALGVDEGVLLSDKGFVGSDTLATGKVLACGIKKAVPDFDLILCGQMALDGDTAQTGVTISNFLGIEHISFANSIEILNDKIKIKQELDNGYNILQTNEKILVSMSRENFEKRSPKINDYIKAQDKEIKILTQNDLEINLDECGIKGSPTWVSKVFRKQTERTVEEISNNVDEIIKKINEVRQND